MTEETIVVVKPAVVVVPAHTQKQERTEALFYYPDHLPRVSDPHYKIFHDTRKRVLALGVGCWICGTKEHLELHHQQVEFAAANGVDLLRFEELFPEYHLTDEESFLCWVEGDGNLLVLCAAHHRSPWQGIHSLPEPNWKLQRFWRKDLPSPVQKG